MPEYPHATVWLVFIPSILSRRSAPRPAARPDALAALHARDAAPATRSGRAASRRRYRSRNCRSFRRYGAFFQFAEADHDTANSSALVQGRRSVDRRRERMARELEEVYSRVQQLLEQRDLVESRLINARTHAVAHAVDVAKRFYELFSHGLDPVNRASHCREAETFLRAAVVNDAVCTEFTGIEPFLKQYQVGTMNHAAFVIDLKRLTLMDHGNDSIQIKAETTTRFRISRRTLEKLFPSIIQDEELAQRLIGKEYEMQYDKVFHFANGRIFQHESRIPGCCKWSATRSSH